MSKCSQCGTMEDFSSDRKLDMLLYCQNCNGFNCMDGSKLSIISDEQLVRLGLKRRSKQ
jgi:hypothetical protein